MSDILHADHFKPLVGQHFATDGGPEPLTLIEVSDQPNSMANSRQAFILIFRGPKSPVLPEGWRAFRSSDGPAFAFHMMPIHTPSRDHQDYQAIFGKIPWSAMQKLSVR